MDWIDAATFFVGFLIAYCIGYWFGKRRGDLVSADPGSGAGLDDDLGLGDPDQRHE
jgi:hypothetical protein